MVVFLAKIVFVFLKTAFELGFELGEGEIGRWGDMEKGVLKFSRTSTGSV
jgi:hypothetical protein